MYSFEFREIRTINALPYHLRWSAFPLISLAFLFNARYYRDCAHMHIYITTLTTNTRVIDLNEQNMFGFGSQAQSQPIEHVLVADYISIGISINRRYKTSFTSTDLLV